MPHLLKHTLKTTEGLGQWTAKPAAPHYLLRLGDQWPNDPRKRLIHETTPDPAKAHQFDTAEDARATLAQAGSPPGWEVVEA